MKITEINRQTCKQLRDILQDALNKADVEGVDIQVGRATFNDSNVTFKIEVAVKEANGQIMNKDVTNWKRSAASFGLPVSALGKTVKVNGDLVEIIGLRPRSTKYPVLIRKADDKVYKSTVAVIKAALARRFEIEDEVRSEAKQIG